MFEWSSVMTLDVIISLAVFGVLSLVLIMTIASAQSEEYLSLQEQKFEIAGTIRAAVVLSGVITVMLVLKNVL